MKIKPSIPKGVRDFLPEMMARRNYITSIIKTVFEKYGFQQIETPAIEHLQTLTGKYGEEGDKLLFKILNSGDYLSKANEEALSNKDSRKLTSSIAKKGLHYDLTVPLARFVAQHQNDLVFPFKRYQMQPVWRADRPQKGRYQEFWQCDADVIGSKSLLSDTEFVLIFVEVFEKLKINTTIRLNNRKILAGIAEYIDATDKLTDMTVAIDKLDKIGKEGIVKELDERGFESSQIEKLTALLFDTSQADFKEAISKTEHGKLGFEELDYVKEKLSISNATNVEYDFTLARGLDYYTSTIYEVMSNDVQIGTIASGGRYDDLTETFGLPNMPGVGISFGLDRIYDVMDELNIFPNALSQSTKILFINFDAEGEAYSYKALLQLRESGIKAELYPESTSMKKQMKYANNKSIPYVVMAGSNEIEKELYTLKDMSEGTQTECSLDDLIKQLA